MAMGLIMQSNDKEFYLQGTDFDRERFSESDKISFEWNIAYQCNFRCPYCFFEGKWDEYGQRTVFLSVDEWMERWKEIYDRYGSVSIIVTGGEPFVYPHFIELIRDISSLHYPVNISTNGSGDIEKFTKMIDPRRVSVSLSFHPSHVDLDSILMKSRYLRARGFSSEFINWCAYPPFLPSMDSYLEKARLACETLKVIPFVGVYNGKSYPDGYSAEEKKKLGMGTVWEKNVKREGTRCAAGQRSALIFPDGKVARCGQVGERFLLGNIVAGDFRLMDSPLVCDAGLCPCLKAIRPGCDEGTHRVE